tara:strand:- start:70 stop:396 length:327 start_codon:yes stop_codon:yes gene_type:complete
MSIIDAAVSHFSSKEIRSRVVPEWECTVYAKNLTLEDKGKLLARAKDNTTDYLVYALIYGAIDGSGEPLFQLEDKAKLKNKVDPEVLAKIANFILAADSSSDEEVEKN